MVSQGALDGGGLKEPGAASAAMGRLPPGGDTALVGGALELCAVSAAKGRPPAGGERALTPRWRDCRMPDEGKRHGDALGTGAGAWLTPEKDAEGKISDALLADVWLLGKGVGAAEPGGTAAMWQDPEATRHTAPEAVPVLTPSGVTASTSAPPAPRGDWLVRAVPTGMPGSGLGSDRGEPPTPALQ